MISILGVQMLKPLIISKLLDQMTSCWYPVIKSPNDANMAPKLDICRKNLRVFYYFYI